VQSAVLDDYCVAFIEYRRECPPNVITLSCKPPHMPAPSRRGSRRDWRCKFGGSEVRLACRRAVPSRPRRLGRRTSGSAAWQLV